METNITCVLMHWRQLITTSLGQWLIVLSTPNSKLKTMHLLDATKKLLLKKVLLCLSGKDCHCESPISFNHQGFSITTIQVALEPPDHFYGAPKCASHSSGEPGARGNSFYSGTRSSSWTLSFLQEALDHGKQLL